MVRSPELSRFIHRHVRRVRLRLALVAFCGFPVVVCAIDGSASNVSPPLEERAGEARSFSSTNSHPHWHSVRIEPSLDHPEIRTRDKFNPIWWFKNADDPIPPEWYRPHDKHRLMKWGFRNPLHNFTFYVVGVADKSVVRSGRYPADNFSPKGGWNLAVTRHKWLYLPFASWCHGQKGFHYYCGWRSSGNFGFKCDVE